MCSILSVVIRTMGGHGSHPAPQRPDRHPRHKGTAPAALLPAALRRRSPCPGDRLQPPAPGVEDGPRRDLPGPVPGDRRDELRGARHGRCPLGRVGTLRVGDPKGICNRDAGPRQNLRLRTWRRTHLVGALKDKAELAGIRVVEVNERGTSSTCPLCRQKVPKPRGRTFSCSFCGFRGHRDVVGAANIAAGGGRVICGNPRIEHRRGLPPHGVTGDAIAMTSAGPAWPMAAGGPRAPGVACRRVRRGRVIFPLSGRLPGHRQSARNRFPASFWKRAQVSGQGITIRSPVRCPGSRRGGL